MATENPVFQILAPSGNQALIAKDHVLGDLAVGQLGIFNFHTGQSIDGTVPENAKDIFLAVGINTSGAGGGATLEDIRKSAGQMIQVRNTKSLDLKPYIAPLPNIWEISGFGAKCETNYSVKIEMRSQQSYGVNGFNQFAKTFNFETGCCTDTCATCPTGDPNELALGLMKAINADIDKIQTASLFVNRLTATVTAGAVTAAGNITVAVGTETFTVAVLLNDTATQVAAKIAAAINTVTTSAYAATSAAAILSVSPKFSKTANTALISLSSAGGTGVTMGTFTVNNANVTIDGDGTIATFIAANPGVNASLRITANQADDVPFNGNIPVKYYSSRDQKLIISLVDGFDCNGTIVETQSSQIEDGYGRELAFLEYEAGGWNGNPGPYRTSAVTGLQKGNYDSFITPTAKYTQVVLTYDQFSVGGWLEYLNNLMSIIAIPCADSVTLQSLFTMFDAIFTNFKANSGLAATVTCNGAGNIPTSQLALANNGIESLA